MPPLPDTLHAPSVLLEARRLAVTYPNGHRALHPTDLKVLPGEFLVLLAWFLIYLVFLVANGHCQILANTGQLYNGVKVGVTSRSATNTRGTKKKKPTAIQVPELAPLALKTPILE